MGREEMRVRGVCILNEVTWQLYLRILETSQLRVGGLFGGKRRECCRRGELVLERERADLWEPERKNKKEES